MSARDPEPALHALSHLETVKEMRYVWRGGPDRVLRAGGRASMTKAFHFVFAPAAPDSPPFLAESGGAQAATSLPEDEGPSL